MKLFFIYLTIFIGLFLTACSSSKEYTTPTPPEDFNKDAYINPENFSEDAIVSSYSKADNKEGIISHDTTFVRAHLIGGLMKLQQQVPYPEEARTKGKQGRVIGKIYIDETGKARHVEIIESPHSSLSETMIKAFKIAEFKPAQLNNKPVKSILKLSLLFKISLGEKQNSPAFQF